MDRNIIDFSSKITPELGASHKIPKYLLREALKNYVPEHLMLDKKQGFSINLSTLLNNELKEEVSDLLNSTDLFPFDTLDLSVVRDKCNQFFTTDNNNPWSIWIIYSLQKFAVTHNLR